MNPSKLEKKANKKQMRSKHMLLRETGIQASDYPTNYLMVCNAGLVTGMKREWLLELCLPLGLIENIIMLPGKSYCFVVFKEVSSALNAYNLLHGKVKSSSSESGPLYFAFTKQVPNIDNEEATNSKPQGLIVIENFVSDQEEELLLNCVDWKVFESGQSLKHRRVTHYGYEFRYDTNNVDKDCPLRLGIPEQCDFLVERLKERKIPIIIPTLDQLTVNQYEPGQGIPGHVDTHSAFEDPILSLSLGSGVLMDFKHSDGRTIPVLLPKRSLLVMSSESRYAWSHGITPRKMDVVPTAEGGLTVQQRGLRTSFTFRSVRKGECTCNYHQHCDSYKRNTSQNVNTVTGDNDIDNSVAKKLEETHVHDVYEEIASHFSDTRHKPWPNVLDFVRGLEKGSILLDVGCGNGKYFGNNKDIYEIGCDRSFGLAKVCNDRGFQVFNCNCLFLPIRSSIVDGCISIAVIHHLASKDRRIQALREIVRILRPGGKALIYVWAKDQERHKSKSTYLKQDRKNRRGSPVDDCNTNIGDTFVPDQKCEGTTLLPIHTNRTQFQHRDVLVPWKVKPTKNRCNPRQEVDVEVKGTGDAEVPTFLRYYHVFDEGELESLCGSIEDACVINSFYDQGNWCVVLQKSDI